MNSPTTSDSDRPSGGAALGASPTCALWSQSLDQVVRLKMVGPADPSISSFQRLPVSSATTLIRAENPDLYRHSPWRLAWKDVQYPPWAATPKVGPNWGPFRRS